MNKIEQEAAKGIILLDLYQKYIREFVQNIPHSQFKTDEQNYIDRRLHRKVDSFEKWFNKRMMVIQAEKIYGKEALQNLINMGVEINLVPDLNEPTDLNKIVRPDLTID